MSPDRARLARSFFTRDPVTCARDLIGCTLGFGETSGIVVETEAYAAEDDPACHTWVRPSAREFVARNPAGTAYVYLNYGMHWLFNLLVKGSGPGGRDGFVLVRALEPAGGIPLMNARRGGGVTKPSALCNGPAKLTKALGIDGRHHGADPFSDEGWVLGGPEGTVATTTSVRIGISRGREFPWRFLLKDSPCVSVKV